MQGKSWLRWGLVCLMLGSSGLNGAPGTPTEKAEKDDAPKGVPTVGLEAVGDVANWHRDADALRLDASDGSQVEITFLAPDVARVRASFHAPLAPKTHSWAIEKTNWPAVSWQSSSDDKSISAQSAQLTVRVQKSPLLITFLDPASGKVLQRDVFPMAHQRNGSFLVRKALGFDEHFYGLGEKAARLDKRRGLFTMWNSDTPGYKEGTDPLYQSVPFYLGWQAGSVYGVFFDNSYKSYFDFGSTSQEWASFGADGGDLDYYFFAGPTFANVLSRYTELTGRMPLPPKWALGNQQSRWSYYPSTVAEEVVKQYRDADLPLDVLHLDIDYMNGFRVFTWEPLSFPNPKATISALGAQGVKVVTIIDPGVKYDTSGNYSVVEEGLKNNYFLRRTNGDLYVGKVWPGDSLFVDYTIDKAREWWGGLHAALTDQGVAGIWNDMNEPSDFVDQTGASQADVVNDDLGEHSLHAKNRNVFGMLMSRATYEGLLKLRPGQRPYVITRAGFAGVQRYATMWTGDNTSTWKSLQLSVPMFQSLGMSGEAFIGGDIGGFIGRADYELLTRWYQVSWLAPFCRNHKVKDGYDHEPFRYPDYYRDIVRKYLKLRYRLLPYLYTVLEEAHRTGMPFFRPLLLNYPGDRNVLNLDDQYMIGTDLLVAPVLRRGQTQRLVYFPAGQWVDYWTGQRVQGPTTKMVPAPLETVPLYVRAGAILPLGPEQNFVDEKPDAPIELYAYLDAQKRATGSLYFDDGISTDYLSGKALRLDLTVTEQKLTTVPSGDTSRKVPPLVLHVQP